MLVFHPEKETRQTYDIALLIKQGCLNKQEIYATYVKPLEELGIKAENIIALGLPYTEKTIPIKTAKENLKGIVSACVLKSVKILLVADTIHFKALTKIAKIDKAKGEVLVCDYEKHSFHVIMSLNYKTLYYNPTRQEEIDVSLKLLSKVWKDINGGGSGIPKSKKKFNITHITDQHSIQSYKQALDKLKQYPALTCDVEATGLHTGCIVSIAFGINDQEAIAFSMNRGNPERGIKELFEEFFREYKGTIIYHNATFDIKTIIQYFFLKNTGDYKNIVEGLEILTRSFHDTMLITYLATNTTARHPLSLKMNSYEYMGNYQIQYIDDILKNPIQDILRYNAEDCIATWYVFNKYWNRMVVDKQLEVYNNIFLPTLKTITLMELNGMCIHLPTVEKTTQELNTILTKHNRYIKQHSFVKHWEKEKTLKNFLLNINTFKTKIKGLDEHQESFDVNSTTKLRDFLFTYLGLDSTRSTDKGQESVDFKTLKSLRNTLISQYQITDDEIRKELL